MALLHRLSNYLILEAQRALGMQRVVGMPYYVVLDPTSYCQLDCPFCGRAPRPLATLKLAEFERIIDGIGKTCVNLELYNWGEPFLNKEILAMIRYATGRYGIHTRISSNLNLRNDELYRELVTSGLNSLTISVDGASQETYEKYRVKGSFDAVIANIKLLVARKRELARVEPKLVWQFLVFRHNEHEIEKAQRMARELGVDEIVFRKPSMPAEYRAWDSSLPAFSYFGAGAGQGASCGTPVNGSGSAPVNGPVREPVTAPSSVAAQGTVSLRERRAEPEPPRGPERVLAASASRRCDWPYSAVAINANGAVSPCCGIAEPEEDFGSVQDAEFADIWNNREFRIARKYVRQHVVAPDSDNTCARCTFKGAINNSPNLLRLLYYSVGPLRRLWIRWRRFRVKFG